MGKVPALIFSVCFILTSLSVFADPNLWDRYAAGSPSGKTFPAGSGMESLTKGTAQVGSWAVYRVLNGTEVRAVFRLAVAAKDADAQVFEFGSWDGKKAFVVQEAVKGLDQIIQTGDAAQGQVIWVKIKNKDGKVITLDGDMLAMGGGMYKGLLLANSAKFTTDVVAGGPVTVPAGTFAETWKAESHVTAEKNSEEGHAWVSTVVPLWHLVKAVNNSGTRTVELVDFGTSGFQSEFKN